MEHAEFTIQIRRETLSTGEDIYVALCLELDIASQGETLEQAKANVTDAIESFFEVASPAEIERRLQTDNTTITVPIPLHREIAIGTLSSIIRQSGLARRFFEV